MGFTNVIVGYIGISGVYRTAADGTFLGRQWSSFMVPGMVIACVILMSPIPSKNGVTIGQYVFVRGLIFGSNFADFALKKAFEVNATATAAGYNHSAEFMEANQPTSKTSSGSIRLWHAIDSNGLWCPSRLFRFIKYHYVK